MESTLLIGFSTMRNEKDNLLKYCHLLNHSNSILKSVKVGDIKSNYIII